MISDQIRVKRQYILAAFLLFVLPTLVIMGGRAAHNSPTPTLYYAPELLFYTLTISMLLIAVFLGAILVFSWHKTDKDIRWLIGAAIILAIHFAWIGLFTEGVGFSFTQTQIHDLDWLVQFFVAIVMMLGLLATRYNIPSFVFILLLLCIGMIVPIGLLGLPEQYAFALSPVAEGLLFGAILLACTISTFQFASDAALHQHTQRRISFMVYAIHPTMVALRFFPLWHPVWWLIFIVSILAYGGVAQIVLSAYLREFQFNLTHYFALAGGVIIVLLAMTTSVATTRRQQKLMQGVINIQGEALATMLATQIDTAANPIDASFFAQLPAPYTNFDCIAIYDHNGDIQVEHLNTTDSPKLISSELVENVLQENKTAYLKNVQTPGIGTIYQSISAAKIGPQSSSASDGSFVVMAQNLPELAEATRKVRLTGLGITGASVAFTFSMLLVLVHYADKLLMGRAKQLKTAFTDLQHLEKMRDDMTQMIVHDLRTPLTTIQLNLNVLQHSLTRNTKVDKQKKSVKNALTSTERMMYLLNDILDLSQIESGRLELNRTLMPPVEIIQERVLAFEANAQSQGKRISYEYDNYLPLVMVDLRLIQRVLDNLISNALRYTRDGGAVVVTADKAAGAIRFSVHDNGLGIPEYARDKIFDKFVQVSEDGEKRKHGVGLGLAFCRLAIEAHGGTIWVKSQVGEGSSFYFTIPTNVPKAPHADSIIVRSTSSPSSTTEIMSDPSTLLGS